MKKIAILTAAALFASAGTYALAQAPAQGTPPAAGQEQGRFEARRGLSQDDFNRFLDARIAAIKAGLKLSADQEKLWQPVETAIRTNATERFSRFQQFRNTPREQRQSMDFMQRLEQRSTLQTENAQRSAAVTTALRPLWNTFSEDQKRIAPALLRPALAGGPMGGRERGGPRDGGRGHHDHMGMMQHGGPDGQRGPAPQQQ